MKQELCHSHFPDSFFCSVETICTKINKILQSEKSKKREKKMKQSLKDVERIIHILVPLARKGQNLPAEEAIDLAERMEPLFDSFLAEINCYLTFKHWRDS